MTRLTKSEILAADDIEERDVDVPKWGGTVRIRTFSKRKADEMRKQATLKDRATGKETVDRDKLEALLFVEGVIDPQFDLNDYEQLLEKSDTAVSVILKAIIEASGLSEAAVDAAYKSPERQPRDGIRVLPQPGAENDAGGTAATDVG